jgi:hypothetical protein
MLQSGAFFKEYLFYKRGSGSKGGVSLPFSKNICFRNGGPGVKEM